MTQDTWSIELKKDIDRIFELDSTQFTENVQPWDLLLTKETVRQWEAFVPETAHHLFIDGFQQTQGIWYPKLRRYQRSERKLWQRSPTVQQDNFRCVLMDFAYSGGGGLEIPFDYQADLTQPEVPYDERVAAIVKACLEAET